MKSAGDVARDAKCRDMVTVALRDCTYSATDEAQAASLANIDDFLGYVMNAGEVLTQEPHPRLEVLCRIFFDPATC